MRRARHGTIQSLLDKGSRSPLPQLEVCEVPNSILSVIPDWFALPDAAWPTLATRPGPWPCLRRTKRDAASFALSSAPSPLPCKPQSTTHTVANARSPSSSAKPRQRMMRFERRRGRRKSASSARRWIGLHSTNPSRSILQEFVLNLHPRHASGPRRTEQSSFRSPRGVVESDRGQTRCIKMMDAIA